VPRSNELQLDLQVRRDRPQLSELDVAEMAALDA
jgi:hypothetical protein